MKSTKAIITALTLGSSLAITAVANAAPPPGVPAVRAHEVRDERRDLKELERLQQRFDKARARGDRFAMRAVERELAQYVDAELREARSEVREARGDVRRNERGARREVREESRERQQLRAIERELDRLFGRTDRAAVLKKRALIRELVQLAEADLIDSRQERRERRRV